MGAMQASPELINWFSKRRSGVKHMNQTIKRLSETIEIY